MSNIIGLAHIANQQAITQKIVLSHPFVRANHLINLPIPDHLLIAHNQFVGSTIRDTAQDIHANTTTSAYHAKVITPGPNVLETGVDPLCESHLAPRRSLTFECDTVNNRQLQMFSRPTHNPAQPQICHATYTPQIGNMPQHLQIFIDQYNIQVTYRTPLNVLTLTRELEVHPDRKFVHTLIHNLTYGCNIGYNGPDLDQISSNLQSAYHQPIILDTAIANECQAG